MSAALVSRVGSSASSDPAAGVQVQAQISVLKQANAAQADMVRTLIAGVGGKLNVTG